MKKLILILVVALGLRLVAINQSLWLDEAIGANIVKDYSYHAILTDFLHSDNHPPLYYLTLKAGPIFSAILKWLSECPRLSSAF
jgi:hypothetical protein